MLKNFQAMKVSHLGFRGCGFPTENNARATKALAVTMCVNTRGLI